MSVVALKRTETEIQMTADSIVVKWENKRNNPKEFTKIESANGMVIGGCGCAEEITLMQTFMKSHKPKTGTVDDVMTFLIEFKKWKVECGSENEVKNEYLIMYDKRAFATSSLFVHEILTFDAIGAGESFARMALHLGKSAAEAIKLTCDLCYLVSKPVIGFTMSLETGEIKKMETDEGGN